MKIAHFFDIDVLINLDNKVWIVSRDNPSIPIIKITKSEFNLIKSGIYKKFYSSLEVNGQNYWLPENLLNELKIRCKRHRCDITNLSFSMQEFLNAEVIENIDYEILTDHFQHLINRTDDIYVICSKNNKKSYGIIIKKLEKELLEVGLKIKKYYYLSETFHNRDQDEIIYKKIRLLLQHLTGFKTEGNKFTDEDLEKYNRIYFYDDDLNVIKLAKESNKLLSELTENSEEVVKSSVKNNLKGDDTVLVVREVTHNKINIFKTNEIILSFSHIRKTFESFKKYCLPRYIR